jgi:tetratricopeptide (TPR) repeat protein
LSPVSKIRLALAGLVLLAGCAAPADRTKQLLELDLANRQGAIESLQKQQTTDPQPWQAYSLGVLFGAEGDYANMNLWFARCSTLSPVHNGEIEFVRLGHWRDEAREADLAAQNSQWPLAVSHLEKALLAVPEKPDTRLRLIEARVMAFGPGLEEIRTLVAAERPEIVYRWLEQAAQPDQADQRLPVRVRLASQIEGTSNENGDALAAYVTGELCRLDGDWLAMDKSYSQSQSLDNTNPERRKQISRARSQVATGLLQNALVHWSFDNVPTALANLDTAEMVDPGRADIVQARRNITALDRAHTSSQVAETLGLGDLDQRWLTFWMSRLYTEGRLRDAGMVSNELLQHADSLNPQQKSQALRVRVAFSRSAGNLDQTRDDLRELLAMGKELPAEAVILGDVLLAQSRYEEARHWFDQARQWGDDSVSLILKKARIAFSQDHFTEMQDLALEASELDPGNKEAQQLLDRAGVLLADEGGRK